MYANKPLKPLRDQIYKKLQEHPLQATLFDPENDLDSLVKKVKRAIEQGTDIILIGGSSHVQPMKFFKSIEKIKKISENIPVIIYTANFEMITDDADGILYGSVLNSNDMFYLINNSVNASPLLKHLQVEPLATAFLIFEPGMTVGYMLNCHLLPHDNIKIPAAYSLTAENLGYSFVYLEAGSKAPYTVSPEVVKEVRSTISIPIIAGGGITTPERAKELVEAGADILVIGTYYESHDDLKSIIDVIHSTKRFNPNE